MSFAMKYLDGEELFRTYWGMGEAKSITRLKKWYESNDKPRNPRTGKYPDRMGLWKSMWRWAVDNMDDAYEIVNKAFMANGETMTRERWQKEMLSKATSSYQNSNYLDRWKKKVNYPE